VPALPYISGNGASAGTLFGIDTRERNFARVRVRALPVADTSTGGANA
jgi:hypothetical protein